MVPMLLAKIGLPLLARAVGGALSRVDHPAARTAAEALEAVDKGAREGAITPEQIAEANRHMEAMAELDAKLSATALKEINATMRSEVASEDAYVRRWRPTFGYAVALTWTLVMGAVAWAVVTDPAASPAVIAALVNTSPIWGIALGVLGISVVKRSQDKAVCAGTKEGQTAQAGKEGLGQVLRRLAGNQG